jgi:hypothetical protein
MLNIIVKSKEPLKIKKTSSSSSPGVDMSIHVIKLSEVSRETVPLKGTASFNNSWFTSALSYLYQLFLKYR